MAGSRQTVCGAPRRAARDRAGLAGRKCGGLLRDQPGRLAELPRDGQVVAYCRGQFCAMSPAAVRLLRREGYDARVLDGGLPEWRADGLPLTAG